MPDPYDIPDRVFYNTINSLVKEFNGIASNEDMSVNDRINGLQETLDKLMHMAVIEIEQFNSDFNYLDQAMTRIRHVQRIMDDHTFEGAPKMVQDNFVDYTPDREFDTWGDVEEYRDYGASVLGCAWTELFEVQVEVKKYGPIDSQHTAQPPQRLTHLNLKSGLRSGGESGDRTAVSLSAEGRRLLPRVQVGVSNNFGVRIIRRLPLRLNR